VRDRFSKPHASSRKRATPLVEEIFLGRIREKVLSGSQIRFFDGHRPAFGLHGDLILGFDGFLPDNLRPVFQFVAAGAVFHFGARKWGRSSILDKIPLGTDVFSGERKLEFAVTIDVDPHFSRIRQVVVNKATAANDGFRALGFGCGSGQGA